MLPPIEDSILQNNPKFALLHASLTKTLLNPSGSTKQHPAQKDRNGVSEALQTARRRSAKRHLILTALTNLDLSPTPTTASKQDSKPRDQRFQNSPTPSELIEITLLLSARLTNASLRASSKQVLDSTDQWNMLPTHISAIGALISNYLQAQALALSRIANPSTNASFLHRLIPKLIGHVGGLQQESASRRADLQIRRTALVSKTTTLLGLYHLAMSLIIQILEQSKHGSVSRHVRTKAEYLNIVAQTVELESKEKKVRGERMVYTDEVNVALGNYYTCLRDGRERARERRSDAERVLWGYGVGRGDDGEKERVMSEVARVYGKLGKELGEVERDVERLRGD